MRASSLTDIFTWINAVYAIHNDMHSQTGGVMSMGLGLLHSKSAKQRLNTKSSIEAELVGMSEYLPYNIWMLNFMQAQGLQSRTTPYQDLSDLQRF